MPEINGKKILMIIAPDKFRDEELFHTKEVLERQGGDITVVSKKKGVAQGMKGGSFDVRTTYDEVSVEDFDAVVFVGGGGSKVYFDDPKAHDIAKKAYADNKVVCAICIAPSILANAGLLKGKDATVWKGDEFIGILKNKGANYTGDEVTTDGRIVTGNGPEAAKKFAVAITKKLQ